MVRAMDEAAGQKSAGIKMDNSRSSISLVSSTLIEPGLKADSDKICSSNAHQIQPTNGTGL